LDANSSTNHPRGSIWDATKFDRVEMEVIEEFKSENESLNGDDDQEV